MIIVPPCLHTSGRHFTSVKSARVQLTATCKFKIQLPLSKKKENAHLQLFQDNCNCVPTYRLVMNKTRLSKNTPCLLTQHSSTHFPILYIYRFIYMKHMLRSMFRCPRGLTFTWW